MIDEKYSILRLFILCHRCIGIIYDSNICPYCGSSYCDDCFAIHISHCQLHVAKEVKIEAQKSLFD